MSIRLQNIRKKFNQTEVIAPLSLDIQDGEMMALLGPSGSGKTTLLRIIAGLECSDEGKVFFGDKDVTNVHVRERRVGFVFQHYALFQHLTVADNVAFGLTVLPKKQRPSKADIKNKVDSLLKMVQLDHLATRYPNQLSGGQKQRIALVRALATDPSVLLLDEPFGALDAQVRIELRKWLRRLHSELKFTSVFVTHDHEEAFELADRVAVLHDGKIQQVDAPTKLYESPANGFVFDFLGHVNEFAGVLEGHRLVQGQFYIDLPPQTALLIKETARSATAEKVTVLFRSHELLLNRTPVHGNNLSVRVTAVTLVGAEVRVSLEALDFDVSNDWVVVLTHAGYSVLRPKVGDVFFLQPRVGHLFTSNEQSPETLSWDWEDKPEDNRAGASPEHYII